MKNLINREIVILSTLFISWSCVTDTIPPVGSEETFDHILLIQTDTSSYDYDSVVEGILMSIHAILRNPSADTFYARLGDGFNGALDQDLLYIAEGTDGRFQKLAWTKDWCDLRRGVLTEGDRTGEILPSTE